MESVEQYQQFYTDQKDRVFSYLLTRCGDREVAKDITQESFARHLKQYGKVKDALAPSLLFTIARNALIDYQRQRTKQRTLHVAPVTVIDEEKVFIRKEENLRLLAMLNELADQDREMLSLVVGGMSYQDVGALFSMSIASTKVRIHRSRKKLRQLMKREVR